MILVAIVFWAVASPMGYLAGDVYRQQMQMKDSEWLPWACAILTPMGAFVAAMAIMQAAITEEKDDEL